MRQSQSTIQKSKNQTHFPTWHLGEWEKLEASFACKGWGGAEEGQRRGRGNQATEASLAGSLCSCPSLQLPGLWCPLHVQACAGPCPPAWSDPRKVWYQTHHFSFFSSPFDVEASVPSLDSVAAAGSLGFDSS